MGAESAVEIMYRKELKADPDCREQLNEAYKERYINPYLAAARGHIDEVIEPGDTRVRIAAALEAFKNKQRDSSGKRHGNIPL